MLENGEDEVSAETLLLGVQELFPLVAEKAREARGFSVRWKIIISKLERIPSCLSDLSSHPCFSKSALCKEQLQSVSLTLKEAVQLADSCSQKRYEGKLQMQSDLDALSGKLDLNLHDCGLLISTGALADAPSPLPNVRELLTRLQIGHLEAKHRALNTLLEAVKEHKDTAISAFGRSNVSALVQLLSTTSRWCCREKTVSLVCSLAESGNCENWLVSEGVIPPLIRLVESGSTVCKEKAVVSLQRLSLQVETARCIVGHSGVWPLIEVCGAGDSVLQAAAACTVKNLSAVPELRQGLAEEGVVRVMLDVIDHGILSVSKEHAVECLQNLTSGSESLRRAVILEGGVGSLLLYLDDGRLPQEAAVGALRNLAGFVHKERLLSLGLLPRLVRVLETGSPGAQQAAAATIFRISGEMEVKKVVGEAGCVRPLVKLLEAKMDGAREGAAQAIWSLMTHPRNCKEVKRDGNSVPNLVLLLDSSPQNTAKKYAVSCLASLSASNRCRRLMISYGAIGYLKRLTDMDAPGAKKLQERLERGKLKSFFSIK